MFRFLLLITVVAAGVMFATNPSIDAHNQVVYAQMDQDASKQGFLRRVLVDAQQGAGLVRTQYDNYYLFSTASVDGKLKTIGCFSRVWPWKWDTAAPTLPNQVRY